MGGKEAVQVSFLAFLNPDTRVPRDHSLHIFMDLALAELSDDTSDQCYDQTGRPSLPPKRLLKAEGLMALHAFRSERAFFEQQDHHHLLFRWFQHMDLVEPSFDYFRFTNYRPPPIAHDRAQQILDEVIASALGPGPACRRALHGGRHPD